MPQYDASINKLLCEITVFATAGMPQSVDIAAMRQSADDLGTLIARGLARFERELPSGRLLVVPTAAGRHATGACEPADRSGQRHRAPGEQP